MEKTLLTIGLVAAGICTLAFSANRENKISPKQQTVATSQVKHITIDPTVGYFFKRDNKTSYSFNKTNTTISNLVVNGKKVPDAQVAKYRHQIDALLKQNEQSRAQDEVPDTANNKPQLYKPSDFNDGTTMKVLAGVDGRRQLAYLFKRKGVLYQVFMNNGDPSALYINGEEKPVSAHRAKIDALIAEYRKITPPLAPLPPLEPIKPMSVTAPNMPAMAPMAPMEPMPPMDAMTPIAPLPPLKPDANLSAVTNALIKQGIIKDEDSYDLTINDKYLVVDGVKQSEELHQQMLKKLTKKPGGKINWTFSYHK